LKIVISCRLCRYLWRVFNGTAVMNPNKKFIENQLVTLFKLEECQNNGIQSRALVYCVCEKEQLLLCSIPVSTSLHSGNERYPTA